VTEGLRLGFAFAAGVATFFAPCAYPLMPGYLAFYTGDDGGGGGRAERLRRAVVVGSLASLGFVLVYAALAVIVAAVGTRVLSGIALLELVVGSLLVALGIGMITGRVMPGSVHVRLPRRERSPSGYLAFGIVYAVAAAGCTAPVFAGIAAVALGAGPAGAVLTIGAYAAGMVALMVLVTVLAAAGRDGVLRLVSARTGAVTRLAGALLVAAGAAQMYLFWFRFGGREMLAGLV